MKYSEDFVKRVKEEFPDRHDLHEALDSGTNDKLVGQIIAGKAGMFLQPTDIVKAFDEGRQEDVLADARRAIRILNLHREWLVNDRE